MMANNKLASVLVWVAALILGACGGMDGYNNPSASNTAYPQYGGTPRSGYGVVQSIELVRQQQAGIAGSDIGLGTVAGVVVGGLIGNQMGSGSGNTAATVIGAAGGGYVGHELEKRNQPQSDAYRFTIRMEDGSQQTVMQSSPADIRVGDRVRIDNGVVRRY